MNNQHSHYFFFFFLAAAIVLVYFIFQPFLTPVILAAVFAFIFHPLYKKFLRLTKNSPSISAFLTTIVAVVLILVPLISVGTLIFKESTDLYKNLALGEKSGIIGAVENTINQARVYFPFLQNFKIDLGQYAQKGLEALLSNIGSLFSSFAKIFLNFFVLLTAFYFFLKDGEKLRDYLIALSPLPDADDKAIVSKLESSVSATLKGSLTIGLVQGTLTGIGFFVFGIPSPALWGCVAAVASLIPGLGTSLVIGPGVLFLFFTGNTSGSLGLLVWGVAAVGLIDNFLGPKIIGKRMQLHPLAVFLSVLGGLSFFGPLGFLLGPLSLSVCLALIDIYSELKKY